MPAQQWRIGRNPNIFRPIRDLEDMRRRFDEDFVRPVMHAIWERVPEEAKSWSPAIDIYEKGDSLVIKTEIPGMKQEDIDVYVTEDTLTIKGERKPDAGIKDSDYHRSEIAYGGFYRSIDLPFGVDTQSIDAIYEDGILRINLKRTPGARPRRVTVQVKKGAA
jgi:HSP20 family protein